MASIVEQDRNQSINQSIKMSCYVYFCRLLAGIEDKLESSPDKVKSENTTPAGMALYNYWRRLIFVYVLLCTAPLPRSTASNISDIIWMLGPRTQVDVIGLLDRSQGVGGHNFYYFVHPFFKVLLNQYATVHPNYARSAVVTFARDATVDYDTISGPDAGVSSCELFGVSPSLWDRVGFVNDPTILRGTNISGAMQHAVEIMDAGRLNRPNVTQVKPHNVCYFKVKICPERFLLQPLVCGTVFHHTALLPPLSIFCCHLKSHLFSLSYPAF